MKIQVTETEPKTVFISRELTAGSNFATVLNGSGHHVIAESLISTSQVRYTYTPQTDWVFFSSKNAIHYFFVQNPELSDTVKFAVMSRASADFLAEHGKTATFIGEGVNVTSIAKDFALFIGDETVLFPQAIDSLQTIQKQLSFTNNCFNLFVYKTTLRTDFSIPVSDILVFTSPSNVKAYYEKYKPEERQTIIAIGSTTSTELKNYGIKEVVMPEAFDENGLLEAICKQLEITCQ